MPLPEDDPRTPKELALATIAALQEQVREWDAEEERERRKNAPEPAKRWNKWTISILYKTSKARGDGPYEYLIFRSPMGGYYTTGAGPEKYFGSWEALVHWLNSDRIVWHSPMRPLATTASARPGLEARGNR